MNETFEQYRSRLLGYLGSRDPIAVQRATPATLASLVSGIPRRTLTAQPAPGKWSILEIVAHMADAELAMSWRLRTMLATPGAPLAWFDEHVWSRELRYNELSIDFPLATFRALRRANIRLLLSVPRSVWTSAYGVHERRGHQTVAEFASLEAAHDLNHLRQIRGILHERRKKSGPPNPSLQRTRFARR